MRLKRAICVAVLLAFSCALPADEWRELYDLRYGEHRREVDRTGSKKDDAAMAAEHLKSAAKYADQPLFAKVLLEQAYELGIRGPGGHGSAVAAVERLMRKYPAERPAYREKLLKAYDLRYRHAPKGQKPKFGRTLVNALAGGAAMKARAKDYRGAVDLVYKAYTVAAAIAAPEKELYRARRMYYQRSETLGRNPGDAKLRASLVRHCVVEMADPAEAVKLLTGDVDETLRTYVPLAAGRVEDVSQAMCLELATWYRQLCGAASPTGPNGGGR